MSNFEEKIIDTFTIGRTTINLMRLVEERCLALRLQVDGDDESDAMTFEYENEAYAAFQAIKDGANPWQVFGITEGIPTSWDEPPKEPTPDQNDCVLVFR